MKAIIKSIKVREDFNRQGEPHRYNNKMYIWPEGETILENLKNRRNRPYTFYKKEIIPAVMEQLKESHPVVYERLKASDWGWRKNCGCSMCPCSPGFVSTRGGQYDISVRVEMIEA